MALNPVLALVPARGGSKGLPRKNVRLLAGRPLLEHSIMAARGCPLIDRVIVSTDDDELRAAALAADAEAPFLRPAELSGDDASSDPVVVHAVRWLAEQQGWKASTVVLLQPTSPLRTAAHVTQALELLESSGADTVVSVCLCEHPPQWLRRLDEQGCLLPLLDGEQPTRRQDAQPIYRLNGAVYATRAARLLETGCLVGPRPRGLVMSSEDSVDIDTELDFRLAEWLFEQRRNR